MLDALIKGISLGLLLAISLGPIVFTVIKQSIANGRKGGFAFIAGISCADILLVILSNIFSNLFHLLTAHKRTLAVVASIFLIIVGVYFLFFKKPGDELGGKELPVFDTGDYMKIFSMGFVMNIFNPGIIVFWLTWATTFIGDTLNQRLLIFGTALLLALATDVAKVMLASKIRQKLTARNIHLVNQINGVILIGFGLVIILFER